MKGIRLLFLLILFPIISVANDWEFYSEGSHLIPSEQSDVVIKKEKIVMTFTHANLMQINVSFVFDSPTAGIKNLGFVTPPTSREQTDIYKFSTTVNGQPVPTKLSEFNQSPFKTTIQPPAYKKEEDKSLQSYVYYFEAPFKQGENKVEHSYLIKGAGGIGWSMSYDYVITTISKWKNKRVEDFELIIDMGRDSHFLLPTTFWKNNNKIDWQIIGVGKQIDSKIDYKRFVATGFSEEGVPVTVVKIVDGYVSYKAKNFSPDYDITIALTGYYALPVADSKGFRFDNGVCYGQHFLEHNNEDTEENLRLVKNCPFAKAGYNFQDQQIKKYFMQFYWYDPVTVSMELNYPKTADAIAVNKEVEQWLVADLTNYSKQQLRVIKNTPYALRGYAFKDKELQKIFENKYSWYVPIEYVRSDEIVLTVDEQKLIDKINQLEKDL